MKKIASQKEIKITIQSYWETHKKIVIYLSVVLIVGSGVTMYRSQLSASHYTPELETHTMFLNNEASTTQHMVVNQKKVKETVLIHVTGAVASPGLYQVEKGMRVIDALKMVGGVYPNADLDRVNLAAIVKDGKKINVPLKKKSKAKNKTNTSKISSVGVISINKASESELKSIPGIGPSLARRIIAYRAQHGEFVTINELIKVKGVGAKTVKRFFQKFKI